VTDERLGSGDLRDADEIVSILDGIARAFERAQGGLEDARAAETVPLTEP
jgi:hypothetical protein